LNSDMTSSAPVQPHFHADNQTLQQSLQIGDYSSR
jgi:hypothetical protein